MDFKNGNSISMNWIEMSFPVCYQDEDSAHLLIFATMECSFFYALFVTLKIEFSNSPILEFRVLQNAFKIKKEGLRYFLK